MDIKKIAEEINKLSKGYKISSLQEKRKVRLNLKKVPTQKIFSKIFERYAYHTGGRKELQFNIGRPPIDIGIKDNKKMRYGVAFSLKADRNVQDIDIFKPLIRRYNEYIRENLEKYSDLKFWYRTKINDERINVSGAPIINGSILKKSNFIFLGKEVKPKNYLPHEVLSLFDRLFPLYEYVEGSHCIDESIQGDREQIAL